MMKPRVGRWRTVLPLLFAGVCFGGRGDGFVPPPRDIGLVLSGGGAKGSYEIGVWQAICEADLDKRIGAISGTSVGSLCAVLFSSVGNPKRCESIWVDAISNAFNVNTGSILAMTLGDSKGIAKYLNDNGLMSKESLRHVIDAHLTTWPPQRTVHVYATATAVNTRERRSFQLDTLSKTNMIERVIASAAVPIAYSPQQINGERHLDGYLSDNQPVAPIIEADSKNAINTIIVVYLSHVPEKRITQDDVGQRRLVEIIPTETIDLNIKKINFAVIDTRPETVRRLIDLGRKDAEKVLKREGLWPKMNHQ